jgi:hypothetical protein
MSIELRSDRTAGKREGSGRGRGRQKFLLTLIVEKIQIESLERL